MEGHRQQGMVSQCRHAVMNVITVALGFPNVMNSLQQKPWDFDFFNTSNPQEIEAEALTTTHVYNAFFGIRASDKYRLVKTPQVGSTIRRTMLEKILLINITYQ
jgi:hypothetical protein